MYAPLLVDLRLRSFLFFFQAEDGIRDYKVTGVQTCALPIFAVGGCVCPYRHAVCAEVRFGVRWQSHRFGRSQSGGFAAALLRSEERRVGKECRSRGWAEQ